MSANGQLTRHATTPEEDLKALCTNTLINSLVQKYWSEDLSVIELRNKANKCFSGGNLQEAMQLYDKAFNKDPNDHLVASNRSITRLRMGNVGAALEDANLAVSLKPDWAKGYLRRANALRNLGDHAEAFKAFFTCLILEGGMAKPVKQELAKELHLLLKNAAEKAMTNNTNKETDSVTSASSSSTSLSDLVAFKVVDLPQCLRELGDFLDKLEEDEQGEAPGWLTLHLQEFHRPFRELDMKAMDKDDYECPLCMRMLWKPITTPCGHTFCKTCLDRVLDHNATCPMCKSATLKTYLSERREAVPNEFIEYAMKKFLAGEYSERMKIQESEMQRLAGQPGETNSAQIPVFVCTMGFPSVPCPLHIFEPRYRLMVRRCMEVGTREFGMCCQVDASQPYADYGTMLEIRDIQFFPDGRSIVDTMGSRRFKVLERNILDGYNTAKVEFLKDEKVPENELEELKKLHDDTLKQVTEWFEGSGQNVQRGITAHYGKLPEVEQDYWTMSNGPTWQWWTLNILPIDPSLKIFLLSMTSLRKRLENTRRILRFLAKAGSKKK